MPSLTNTSKLIITCCRRLLAVFRERHQIQLFIQQIQISDVIVHIVIGIADLIVLKLIVHTDIVIDVIRVLRQTTNTTRIQHPPPGPQEMNYEYDTPPPGPHTKK